MSIMVLIKPLLCSCQASACVDADQSIRGQVESKRIVLFAGAPIKKKKMTQIPLVLEMVWLNKAKYERAERNYYENLARVSF